jgi:hypothetical protein
MSACHAEDREFKSRPPRQIKSHREMVFLFGARERRTSAESKALGGATERKRRSPVCPKGRGGIQILSTPPVFLYKKLHFPKGVKFLLNREKLTGVFCRHCPAKCPATEKSCWKMGDGIYLMRTSLKGVLLGHRPKGRMSRQQRDVRG